MWLTDAASRLVTLRIGVVTRSGALAFKRLGWIFLGLLCRDSAAEASVSAGRGWSRDGLDRSCSI
jgi:hypothetical protein